MLVRSPVTVMPVLLRAGVTATVRSSAPAGSTPDGVAPPTPEMALGSPPQKFAGDELSRGVGAETIKSLPLFLVSVQPLALRTTAVVLPAAPAGLLCEQSTLPVPP